MCYTSGFKVDVGGIELHLAFNWQLPWYLGSKMEHMYMY
jgi:hypothetical protein